MTTRQSLANRLHDIGAIKFGTFTLKSGLVSPFYIDLRPIVSYPDILKKLSDLLVEELSNISNYDYICGVPYSGLSFASAASIANDIPMLIKRKERKKYGTKRLVEGSQQPGDHIVLIEDVVSSGASLLETIEDLKAEQLDIAGILVVIDRQQGGTDLLKAEGFQVTSLFTVTQLLELLIQSERLDKEIAEKVSNFIHNHQIVSADDARKKHRFTYQEKKEHSYHQVNEKLLDIVMKKQTNLIFSADVTSKDTLLQLAEETGPHICALKTHIDIVNDFDRDLISQLQTLAKQHRFLLFEDRKFSDIGNTVKHQFISKHYNIPNWADLVTVHLTAGASLVDALADSGELDETALIAIVGLSSSDSLTDLAYIQRAMEIVNDKKDYFSGIVAQHDLLGSESGLLQYTPGINISAKGDKHGQTYNTPEKAFSTKATDLMIVGRGIYQAENPQDAAINYKQAGWKAYQQSIF